MCTGISLTSQEQHHYWGRTQEFDFDLAYSGMVIPRNQTVNETLTPVKGPYAAAGITIKAYPILIDGVNEKGLAGGSFYFANYHHYAPENDILKAGKIPLRGQEFVTWALINCANVQELTVRAPKEVAIADVENSFPQHYVFYDSTGACVVIEPSVSNGFKIYDNPVGVFTNHPPFDWHMINLQNYVGLKNTPLADVKLGEQLIFSPGKGSGLIGIPGDFTPQSRFVRAAFLKHLADTVPDSDVISHLFHLLNTADITKGVVKTEGPTGKQFTQYTVAYDVAKGIVYYHHYDNRAIQTFRLTEKNKTADSMIFYDIVPTQTLVEMAEQVS